LVIKQCNLVLVTGNIMACLTEGRPPNLTMSIYSLTWQWNGLQSNRWPNLHCDPPLLCDNVASLLIFFGRQTLLNFQLHHLNHCHASWNGLRHIASLPHRSIVPTESGPCLQQVSFYKYTNHSLDGSDSTRSHAVSDIRIRIFRSLVRASLYIVSLYI